VSLSDQVQSAPVAYVTLDSLSAVTVEGRLLLDSFDP